MALSNKVYDQEEGFKDAIGDIVLKTVALKNEIIMLNQIREALAEKLSEETTRANDAEKEVIKLKNLLKTYNVTV